MYRSCIQSLSALLAAASSVVPAAPAAIGIVTSTGTFTLDGANVTGNATLFDGARMETGTSSAQLQLNGQPIAIIPYNGWSQLSPVSITSGFAPGFNTLDFVVVNVFNQTEDGTGIQVAMSGSQIPEPSSIVLATLGGLALITGRRRRREFSGNDQRLVTIAS